MRSSPVPVGAGSEVNRGRWQGRRKERMLLSQLVRQGRGNAPNGAFSGPAHAAPPCN